MSLAEVGVGHSRTTLSLLSCGLMPLTLTTNPTNSSSDFEFRLRIEAFGSQDGKDLTQMKQVLLRSFRVNDQVIKVNGDKRTTAVKNHIHSSLERRRCIAQAERYHLELIGSKIRPEYCAIHMFGKNPNLKKTLLKVHFTKDLGALEAIQ